MKKLWTKFKRWLIVKLGGYLEGPKTYKVEHIDVPIMNVCVVETIPAHLVKKSPTLLDPDEKFREHLKEHLRPRIEERLGKEILKNIEYHGIYTCYDPTTDEYVFKLMVKLAHIKY